MPVRVELTLRRVPVWLISFVRPSSLCVILVSLE